MAEKSGFADLRYLPIICGLILSSAERDGPPKSLNPWLRSVSYLSASALFRSLCIRIISGGKSTITHSVSVSCMYGRTSGLSSVRSATLDMRSRVSISVALDISLGRVAVMPMIRTSLPTNRCAIPE